MKCPGLVADNLSGFCSVSTPGDRHAEVRMVRYLEASRPCFEAYYQNG